MKILQTIAGFSAKFGGTSTCIYDLMTALHAIGCDVDLLTVTPKDLRDHNLGEGSQWLKEGINGFSFASESVEALTERVEWLLCHPEQMRLMQREACRTMQEVWSPAKAASALMCLVDDLQHGRECSIMEGPCSKA